VVQAAIILVVLVRQFGCFFLFSGVFGKFLLWFIVFCDLALFRFVVVGCVHVISVWKACQRA